MSVFPPAQVQVAQAVVEPQAFSQPLHPAVGHPHLPQVELHQAAVHCQHLREMHRPLLLRDTQRGESHTSVYYYVLNVIIHQCDALYLVAEEQRPADIDRAKSFVAFQHDGKRYHTLSGLQRRHHNQNISL